MTSRDAPPTLPLLRRLWADWVKPYRGQVALITLATILVGVASSGYAVVIRWIFDALEAKDGGFLTLAPLLVILVTAVKGFASLAQILLTNRVTSHVEATMQSALYARLIDADLRQLAEEAPAALTQRFSSDFAVIREALTRLVTVVFRDIAIVLGSLASMLWNDWVLTLVAVAVVPLAGQPINSLGRKLRRVARTTQEELGRMAAAVLESLGAARIAKSYQLEPYLKARAAASFEAVRRLRVKAANQRARLEPLLEVGGGVVVAAVLAIIGWRILRGESSIGQFVAFLTALLIAAQPIRTIGNINVLVQEAMASLERFYQLHDRAPEIVDAPDAAALEVGAGGIRFEDVSFSYGDAPALHSVSFVAEGGTTTALVGRSGSGKSTLMALLPRLYEASGGRISIDGQDIRGVTLASLRLATALVSQDTVLFDDSASANIGFGREGASRDEIVAAAKAAFAHDFIMALPEDYETRLGPGGSRLSGGQRQRIAIARAFLKDAPILLLDEATSALDAESEAAIQAALAKLMAGRTVLVIAHRLSTIRAADRIVVLDAGRVVESGTHDELSKQDGLYQSFARLQFREIA